jgi:large subunit ribosomal protein L9
MRVYLLKDVVNVGLAGTIVKVSDGYAKNYILPRKLGVLVTEENEASLLRQVKAEVVKKEVVATKTSLLAERIKQIELVVKRKLHDDGKLYGSINASEIVDGLAAQGVSVGKSQIEFDGAIKAKGSYKVVVKLSTTLKPALTVKIVSE